MYYSVLQLIFIKYHADAEAVCCATFGQGTGEQTILPHNFHCTGGERNLSQCRTSGSSRCNHRQDAGVICSKNYVIAYYCMKESIIKSISFIECDDNTFPCRETTLDNPICISEIQFCDGILDCPEGSNEPLFPQNVQVPESYDW